MATSLPATTTPAETDGLMRLGVAVARLSRGFRSASSAHGLSPSQLSVLSSVVRAGPVGVSALAAGEGLNPTLLSRVVGRLEEQGLVQRSAGAADRRCVVVGPTADGRRMQARIRAERGALLHERLDRLSREESAALFAALPALERMAAGGGRTPGRA
jgi:DNA-binding MarR family transcriptional regulator